MVNKDIQHCALWTTIIETPNANYRIYILQATDGVMEMCVQEFDDRDPIGTRGNPRGMGATTVDRWNAGKKSGGRAEQSYTETGTIAF